MLDIPFCKPLVTGRESAYIARALSNHKLCGDGEFTKLCNEWLEKNVGCKRALLTTSCTAALEMAAILIDLKQDDEVIMPSYTFSSTANAIALRGAKPVFVDVHESNINIDESKIAAAITPKTRAIMVVHYAGISCNMQKIRRIADEHGLFVLEDAAQGICATYQNQPLGSLSHLAAYSFHETKNIICGEGGALLINDPRFIDRAEIIREKGTNRKQFMLGVVDKYTWVDVGSSYLPSELNAAFLYAQLEQAHDITERRLALWQNYHNAFEALEKKQILTRMQVSKDCVGNGHIYYVLMANEALRNRFLKQFAALGIRCTTHYVPLHQAPYYENKYGKSATLPVTESIAQRIFRLPMWLGLEAQQKAAIDTMIQTMSSSEYCLA